MDISVSFSTISHKEEIVEHDTHQPCAVQVVIVDSDTHTTSTLYNNRNVITVISVTTMMIVIIMMMIMKLVN